MKFGSMEDAVALKDQERVRKIKIRYYSNSSRSISNYKTLFKLNSFWKNRHAPNVNKILGKYSIKLNLTKMGIKQKVMTRSFYLCNIIHKESWRAEICLSTKVKKMEQVI